MLNSGVGKGHISISHWKDKTQIKSTNSYQHVIIPFKESCTTFGSLAVTKTFTLTTRVIWPTFNPSFVNSNQTSQHTLIPGSQPRSNAYQIHQMLEIGGGFTCHTQWKVTEKSCTFHSVLYFFSPVLSPTTYFFIFNVMIFPQVNLLF